MLQFFFNNLLINKNNKLILNYLQKKSKKLFKKLFLSEIKIKIILPLFYRTILTRI